MKQHEEMQEMRNEKNHRGRQENWLGADRREDRYGACVSRGKRARGYFELALLELINSHYLTARKI